MPLGSLLEPNTNGGEKRVGEEKGGVGVKTSLRDRVCQWRFQLNWGGSLDVWESRSFCIKEGGREQNLGGGMDLRNHPR